MLPSLSEAIVTSWPLFLNVRFTPNSWSPRHCHALGSNAWPDAAKPATFHPVEFANASLESNL